MKSWLNWRAVQIYVTPSTAMKFRPKFYWKWSFFDQNQQPLKSVEPFERILRALFISPPPPLWNSHRNSFENEAFSTKTSNPLRVQSLLKELFRHCSYHNSRTNSLIFSILEMFLTDSYCFHVISDCFDSFSQDLHAFRQWSPPEICQVE